MNNIKRIHQEIQQLLKTLIMIKSLPTRNYLKMMHPLELHSLPLSWLFAALSCQLDQSYIDSKRMLMKNQMKNTKMLLFPSHLTTIRKTHWPCKKDKRDSSIFKSSMLKIKVQLRKSSVPCNKESKRCNKQQLLVEVHSNRCKHILLPLKQEQCSSKLLMLQLFNSFQYNNQWCWWTHKWWWLSKLPCKIRRWWWLKIDRDWWWQITLD